MSFVVCFSFSLAKSLEVIRAKLTDVVVSVTDTTDQWDFSTIIITECDTTVTYTGLLPSPIHTTSSSMAVTGGSEEVFESYVISSCILQSTRVLTNFIRYPLNHVQVL